MDNLKLTPAERLILANQYEILGTINEDSDSIRLAENIRNGHAYLYMERIKSSIADDLSEELQSHVLNILQVYRLLKSSYDEHLTGENFDPSDFTFPGFDGNNETELLIFAQALANDGRYDDVIGHQAKNSHGPTTEMYERMIFAHQSMGDLPYPLSAEQVKTILDAKVHPSNR